MNHLVHGEKFLQTRTFFLGGKNLICRPLRVSFFFLYQYRFLRLLETELICSFVKRVIRALRSIILIVIASD